MTQMSPVQQNAMIRSAVLSIGQEMFQSIATGSVVPANQPQITIPLRNVGLIRGFLVEVTANLSNTGTAVATRTQWGPAAVLSNVSFTDYDNYQRISTSGIHLNMLNTAKEQFPFGAALLSSATDTPMNYGNNFSSISCPATIAAAGTGTVVMRYYVPLAYSKDDLRGAVFGGVTNASAYLQLTPNAAMGSAASDGTQSVFSGANSAVSCTSLTYNVYQLYIDQLPKYQTGPQAGTPILPPIDLSTQYRLGWTSLAGLTAGQDFGVIFSNYQDFLSLAIIYDQAGTLAAGTDINYFSLTAANTLQLFKRTPQTQAFLQRIKNKVDFPLGSYLFDFRDAPISTNQSGNMQLNVNPITAAAGSNILAGFESFAMINSVLGAASLPSS